MSLEQELKDLLYGSGLAATVQTAIPARRHRRHRAIDVKIHIEEGNDEDEIAVRKIFRFDS